MRDPMVERMAGLWTIAARAYDHLVNRSLGNYVGFRPRRPHELIIPRFVLVERAHRPFFELLRAEIGLRILARPAVLADLNTWSIAGEALASELRMTGSAPSRVIVQGNHYSEVVRAARALTRSPCFWVNGSSPVDQRVYGIKRASVILAVGGGTVIDVAKLTARLLNLPCISIPTSLANDGIASPFAVIDPEDRIPGLAQVTARTNTPLGVVVQLDKIRSPGGERSTFFRDMIRSGVGDVVSNVTAALDWELAYSQGRATLDYVALAQARSAGEVILRRLAEGISTDSDEFLLMLATALISSGEAMTRVGTSRPASGFEHKFYHAFRNVLRLPPPTTHGVLVAIGTLISAHAHKRHRRLIRSAFEVAGLPVTTDQLSAEGIDSLQVIESIHAALEIKPDRYTIIEHLGPDALVEAFGAAFR